MRSKAPKRRKGSGKPAKRVPAVRKKPGIGFAQYMVRCWWILRGAAVGVLVLGFLYILYLGAGKVMELDSLAVRVIAVEGCRNVEPEKIKRLTGVAEGDPLLRVDLKKVRENVVAHPAVRDATVVRELPDTLRISVRERVSAAAVLGRKFALVDTEGVVISLHDSYPEGYPVITGIPEPFAPGARITELHPALEVLRAFSGSGLIGPERVSELEVDGDRVRVSLMGSGTVLVVGRGAAEVQIGKLARLMEAGAFDTRSAGYDLRFKGRIIGMPERKFDEPEEASLLPAGG